MNYTDTLKSVDLILATGEVPLIVGESGIGKTALAKELADKNNWHLVVINGNLLKEGEIGGLPTIESYYAPSGQNSGKEQKSTVYAVHHKLREIDEAIARGQKVLLFIDEINRCEHTVQQELMNLVLNREINGYVLPQDVKILAAMNPSSKYGDNYDYQVVDMDPAQENRFVWLFMEPDPQQWIEWALQAGIEEKVIEFISTFPEYLHKVNEDDLRATPRSYERISSVYKLYKENKDSIPRSVFFNIIRGNVGRVIAEEFLNFVETDHPPLITFEEVFENSSETVREYSSDSSAKVTHLPNLKKRVQAESHTRLYLTARNIFNTLENKLAQGLPQPEAYVVKLIDFLNLYPVDLRIGLMKEIRNNYPTIYKFAIETEEFVETYFTAYSSIR